MSDKIKTELELICKKAGGILRPSDVVSYAEDEGTALHECFEWDDEKAGHEYRLWQARKIIKVHVTVLPNTTTPIQAYVSLKTDRTGAGGGYRPIVDVMNNAQMREQLLTEALEELTYYEEKYKQLQELAPVFEAAKKIRRTVKASKKDSRRMEAAA